MYVLIPALRGVGELNWPRDPEQALHLENIWNCLSEIELPTCQHFIICLPTMGHFPVGEHFPHQHAEGPDIRLGGEVAL